VKGSKTRCVQRSAFRFACCALGVIISPFRVRQTATCWKASKNQKETIWHWAGKEEKIYKRTFVIPISEKMELSWCYMTLKNT